MGWIREFTFSLVVLLSLSGCSSILADLGLEEDISQKSEFAEEDTNRNCDDGDCESRKPVNYDRTPKIRRVKLAIRNNDIVVGMSRSEVIESWGEPSVREVAGAGGSGNERWTYGSRFSLDGERYLIFESGKVVGWYR